MFSPQGYTACMKNAPIVAGAAIVFIAVAFGALSLDKKELLNQAIIASTTTNEVSVHDEIQAPREEIVQLKKSSVSKSPTVTAKEIKKEVKQTNLNVSAITQHESAAAQEKISLNQANQCDGKYVGECPAGTNLHCLVEGAKCIAPQAEGYICHGKFWNTSNDPKYWTPCSSGQKFMCPVSGDPYCAPQQGVATNVQTKTGTLCNGTYASTCRSGQQLVCPLSGRAYCMTKTSSQSSTDVPDTQKQVIVVGGAASYSKVGNLILGSDGTTYTFIGNSLLSSDGTSYHKIGNNYIGSDGSSYMSIGNTTYRNDGTSYTRIGNSIIGSDGSYITQIGNTIHTSQ